MLAGGRAVRQDGRMSETPEVLLVGAGAIGQVFGWHLQSAGCKVSFLVREKYAEQARRGFTLYPLGLRGRYEPIRFSGFDVLLSLQEVAARRWDQVWLCVSSTALREGSWVGELAQATGEATWIMLQPDLGDRDWLLRWLPAGRLVSGMIPFLGCHVPLSAEHPVPEPGTAFWFPPLARGPFSGAPERLQPVLRALKAGGYPARRHRDATRATAIPSALLTALVWGLEAAGWRFERFLEQDSLERVHRTAREAVRIAAWRTRGSASALLPLLRPALFRLLLPLATRVVPVDLETYLRVHFTKVREQTLLMMRTYIALGREANLPVQALQAALDPERDPDLAHP
jgi:hypothetical protein